MVGNMQRQTQKHKKGFLAAAVDAEDDADGDTDDDDNADDARKRNSGFIALSANQVFSRG